MAPVTEIATIPLKAGINSQDANTPEGSILQDTFTTLAGRDGMQSLYFGHEVEDPTMLRMFINWGSIDDHKNFMKDPEYAPFLKNIGAIMDGAPVIYHVALEPHPPETALGRAPATEILAMYYPSSISSADQDGHTANMKTVGEKFASIEGFKGVSGGWSVEDDIAYDPSAVSMATEGATAQKAKVFLAVIGWQSVEAHMAGRQTDVFKEYAPLLRKTGGTLGLKVSHVHAERIDGGSGMGIEERGGITGSGGAQEEILNPHGGASGKPGERADGTTTKNTIPKGNPTSGPQ